MRSQGNKADHISVGPRMEMVITRVRLIATVPAITVVKGSDRRQTERPDTLTPKVPTQVYAAPA